MTTVKKRIIISMLGVSAALFAWPVVELILANQKAFPSYLVFNIIFGAIFGFILGAFLGTGEGILSANQSRIISGAITGAVVGLFGGAIGFLLGQAALFVAGNVFFRSYKSFTWIGYPVSRAIGWACMGIFIGLAEGFRSRSSKKMVVGILGGFIGGILGGFTIEYLRLLFPDSFVSRLSGLLVFGFLIGLFYSIIEKQFSLGILKLLNGSHKGKEFLINQKKIAVGMDKKNDIVLVDYDLTGQHVIFEAENQDVVIKKRNKEASLLVNDKPVDEHILKFEDVIKIGNAKFFFKHE